MSALVSSTRVLPATADGILLAAAALRLGELVAFPTETVYGLGANARDAKAVARIFVAKQRPTADPLIVHVADRAGLAQVADRVTPAADQLIAAFWPGALTLILSRHPLIPPNVSAGLPTVAVRAPSHPVAQALIQAVGGPIAAPSANRFSHVSPTSPAHVLADLEGRIDYVIDGGSTPLGVESTIVDLTGADPVLRRPGAVSVEALRAILPDLVVPESLPIAESIEVPQVAPGQSAVHYAPDAPLTVFDGDDNAIQSALRAALIDALTSHTPESIGLLIAAEDRAALADLIDATPITCIVLGSLADLDGIAASLYSGLRALDDAGVSISFGRMVPPDGIGLAVRDRLRRASGGQVVVNVRR